MKILNVSTPNSFPGIPTFCHPKTLNQKFLSNDNKLSSRFHRNAFSIYLSTSSTRKFQTWAHFGRPTSRRNSLRKKLLDDKQVRSNHILTDPASKIQNPSSSFNGSESFGENSNRNGMEESDAVSQGLSVDNVVENVKMEKTKSKILGDSVLLNKLENWADQYKKDSEYWGIGSGPIFTVYQDSLGNVKRVSVDEEEILRRSGVQREVIEDFPEVNYKILSAKSLAREMENGNNVIARNSSVAKFVVQGEEIGMVKAIHGFIIQPGLLLKLSGVGSKVLYIFVILWAVKKLFTFGDNKDDQYTEMEKEMMRRKIKSRKEKEMLVKGTVEVIPESSDPPVIPINKPKLDKEQLKNNILKAKASADKLVVKDSSAIMTTRSMDTDYKVQEIREMARRAREIEGRDHSIVSRDMEVNGHVIEESSNEMDVIKRSDKQDGSLSDQQNDVVGQIMDTKATLQSTSVDVTENIDNSILHEVVPVDECNLHASKVILSGHREINKQEIAFTENNVQLKDKEDSRPSDTLINDSSMTNESSVNREPRIIRSVKEARDYLLNKCDKQDSDADSKIKLVKENIADLRSSSDIDFNDQKCQMLEMNTIVSRSDSLNGISDSKPVMNANEDSNQKDKEFGPTKNDYFKAFTVEAEVGDPKKSETTLDYEVNGVGRGTRLSEKTENWLEKNFNEVEPIIQKMRAGFRDNYMAAKERVNQPLDIASEVESLEFVEDGGEFDWMQDDHLRDIVFKVRENELSRRDPFYLMEAEDKEAFFRGLEKKVEKENKKLSYVHEWLHSNIENLDYGADGISLYDPLEKIIPRWKGPPAEQIAEFLNAFLEQKMTISTRNMDAAMKDENGFAKKSAHSSSHEKADTSIAPIKKTKNPKTVIEGSDGSVKPGKKSGKEYWQHTKKWSQGFLESYNAETDPEVKSIMRDIGKDLDRWIAEKEIEEAADLMTKIPDGNRNIIEKKINKLKREMELFGPQAVVSKYREYADEKEEDYLWWLDLSHVLCIELYTIDDGEQRVGFYSLGMAADLGLEPKPYHVIAFQDAGDCKNLCYIIQAHMDMLGNGHAFVVAQPPKDAFREAKANGFGVTVIKKGELQLNIDQPLEEVEEQITEIGSKMYHDMIMKERSVDINSIMKGVFGFSGHPTKRLKRMLKKRSK